MRKILFPCVLLCFLAAAAGPEVVSAGVDPLASPTPGPMERIAAPENSGVNPDAVLSEGDLADSLPSDSFDPIGITLPPFLDSPNYLKLETQSGGQQDSDSFLNRNFDEIVCGSASLAQAIIMHSEGAGGKKIDDIVVMNKGNLPLIIR